MDINKIIKEEYNHAKYLKWKKQNVTLRGIKQLGKDNEVWGSFGRGLYTVPLSNKAMAKTYGTVYFVLNAIPKNPKVVQDRNSAEILVQTLVDNFSKKHGRGRYDKKFFEENTTIEDEMQKLGYDGLVIKGREMVNYNPPDDVKYFETERQLMMYYEDFVDEVTTLVEYFNNQQIFNNTWYHGGDVKINNFNKMPPINRRGNTEGFYFTNNINIARNYGNEITSVNLKVKNPFILGKTDVSENMINTYAIELHRENDHLPLDGSWIKEKCQYFKDKKYMPYTGLDGLAQQEIYKSGGFDSVIDGHEICVFNDDDIIIKF